MKRAVVGILGKAFELVAMVVLGLFLSGCREIQTESNIGAFLERSHVRQYTLSWENSIEPRYVEFCNTVSDICYVNDEELKRGLLAFQKFSYPYPGKMVAVHANNENGRLLGESRLHIFRTMDGFELQCDNCQGLNWVTQSKVIEAGWRNNVHYLFTTRETRNGARAEVFWVVSVSGDSFNVRGVKEVLLRSEGTRVSRPILRDDGEEIAWTVCDETCELFRLDLRNNQEFRSAVSCPAGKMSRATWEDNQVLHQCW